MRWLFTQIQTSGHNRHRSLGRQRLGGMALSVKRFPVRQKRVKQWQRNVRRAFDSFACELIVIT